VSGGQLSDDRLFDNRTARPALGPSPSTDEIASAMVLLAVALQSGCGVVEAIEQVAAVGDDPACLELGVVAAALRWGVDDPQAWSVVHPTWSRTALALRLAAVAGVAPSSLLLDGAADLRAAELAAVDVAAARAGVRLVLPLGFAFLPAFVLTTVVPVVLALIRHVLGGEG
jgi:pilus assembly protein TadC